MLFPDINALDLPAFAVGDSDTKDPLAQENSFGMVPKSAMPKIWKECFGLIEPGMDPQVILALAAEFSGATLCVFHWVGHG